MSNTTRFQKQNEYRRYIARIKVRFGANVDACDEGLAGWTVYREVRVAPGMYGVESKVLWSGQNLADALTAPVASESRATVEDLESIYSRLCATVTLDDAGIATLDAARNRWWTALLAQSAFTSPSNPE